MANEMLFMRLTLKGKAVPGDSKIKGYEGQIQLKSMGWGVAIKDKTAAKGATKVTNNWEAKELRISKYFDGATTTLMGHVDEREGLRSSARSAISKSTTDNTAVISMVAVSAVKTGEKMPVIMTITLAGVRIKSMTSRATEGGAFLMLTEDVQLTYQDFKIDYFPAAEGDKRAAATSFELKGKEAA